MTIDAITVMTTKGPLATKSISRDDCGKWSVTPYGNAKVFGITEQTVSNIYDLAAALSNTERNPTSFIVRGAPVAGVDLQHAYRRLHPRKNTDGNVEPATLRPASRHWVPLDVDSIPCRDWLDPIADPDRAVEYVVEHLPAEFEGATCWWQFTASQQIKPGIRMRLFFWSDVVLADWQLKQWLSPYPVDKAIFAAAQPIYVARPIFVGVSDPVPVRSGIWRGDRDTITPPAISKIEVIKKRGVEQRHDARAGGGYDTFRSAIGDHDAGDGFHRPIKSAVASYIAVHGSLVDTAWLRNDLEQAIRTAPRDVDKHPDDYIETRVRDLDTLIPRILEMQRSSETARLDIQECEPTYPAANGSIAEARIRLAEIANQHVSATIAYAAERAAYRARLREWEAQQASVA